MVYSIHKVLKSTSHEDYFTFFFFFNCTVCILTGSVSHAPPTHKPRFEFLHPEEGSACPSFLDQWVVFRWRDKGQRMGVLPSVIHINEAVCGWRYHLTGGSVHTFRFGIVAFFACGFSNVSSLWISRSGQGVLIEVLSVHAGFSNDVRKPCFNSLCWHDFWKGVLILARP